MCRIRRRITAAPAQSVCSLTFRIFLCKIIFYGTYRRSIYFYSNSTHTLTPICLNDALAHSGPAGRVVRDQLEPADRRLLGSNFFTDSFHFRVAFMLYRFLSLPLQIPFTANNKSFLSQSDQLGPWPSGTEIRAAKSN
jgi:hypothetical protein